MFTNSDDNSSSKGGLFSENSNEFTTTYTIERTANHTEISIMKTQWKNICKKFNSIKFKKFTLNMQEIVIGAAIPYIIDVISDYCNQKEPNYFPIFVCFILLLVSFIVTKAFPFCNDNSKENEIYLNDIKGIIEEIDNMEQNI